jgi:mycothiol synthase
VVRAATWDDLPAVAGLWATCDLDDWGSVASEETDVRDDWVRPGVDLASDTWVVTAPDGEVVGYGYIHDEDRHVVLESWALVHPEHRGRGVGTLLITMIERRAMDHRAAAPRDEPVLLRAATSTPDVGGRDLVERRGYLLSRRFWQMEVDLGPAHEQPSAPPPGIDVRRFLPGHDDRAVYDADDEAFSEHWGYVRTSFEEWALKLSKPSFDPSLWYLATDREAVAGFLLGEERLGIGWVGDLAVRKPWRGRGLARHLLRHAFAEFRRRGYPRAGLTVDAENTTGATRLYESVGMRPVRGFDVFERTLDPS